MTRALVLSLSAPASLAASRAATASICAALGELGVARFGGPSLGAPEGWAQELGLEAQLTHAECAEVCAGEVPAFAWLVAPLPDALPQERTALRQALFAAQQVRLALALAPDLTIVTSAEALAQAGPLGDGAQGPDGQVRERLRAEARDQLAALERSSGSAQGGLNLVPWPVQSRSQLARFHDASGWLTSVQPTRPVAGPIPGAEELLTLDAALSLARWREDVPTAALARSGRPCSFVLGRVGAPRAMLRAMGADPLAADGGVLVTNTAVDLTGARALGQSPLLARLRALAAPSFEPDALALLAENPELMLLEVSPWGQHGAKLQLKSTAFGVFVREQGPAGSGLGAPLGAVALPEACVPMLEIALHACRQLPGQAAAIADGEGTLALCGGQPHALDAAQVTAAKARRAARPCAAVLSGGLAHPGLVTALQRAQVGAVAVQGLRGPVDAIIAAADAAGIALLPLPEGWAPASI